MLSLLILSALAAGLNANAYEHHARDSTHVHAQDENSRSGCAEACASLTSGDLQQQVYHGRDGGFVMWDAKQQDLIPHCRVIPQSAEDVSIIIETAKNHHCHFAIRGGGHSRMVGSSNADGGITIDLQNLKDIEVSEDRKSVTIGAGARWGEIYPVLEKEALTVIGGRASDVGIGGLVLGGGISFFSGLHGLASDNVISYEIVLPTGQIVEASEGVHPDLYWALRGGGSSNFGVVTSFVLEAKELVNPNGIWYSFRVHTPEKRRQISAARYEWFTEGIHSDKMFGGYDVYCYSSMQNITLMITQHVHVGHTDLTTSPRIFQPYDAVEPLPGLAIDAIAPMSNVTMDISDASPSGFRNTYSTFTRRPDMALDEQIMSDMDEIMPSLAHVPKLMACFVMQPLSPYTLSQTQKRGGSSLGLSPWDGPLAINSLTWSWAGAEHDGLVQSTAEAFVRRSEQAAKDAGRWHPFKYINYAEKWQEEDVLAGYGEGNLHQLRRIQRKYDPEWVFTKGGLCGGYFQFNEREEPHDGWSEGCRVGHCNTPI